MLAVNQIRLNRERGVKNEKQKNTPALRSHPFCLLLTPRGLRPSDSFMNLCILVEGKPLMPGVGVVVEEDVGRGRSFIVVDLCRVG